ncbi:hypothetical protein NPIL_217331 [Nephila pilipes]|uniref:Uncharacterized protein n=1 Tax=Nephila pilipes TaxID=299642 RepID=A0A8X6PCC8_NEPPI|nr:hypothetical protein NPIL_217331 [Nephila pilipes]
MPRKGDISPIHEVQCKMKSEITARKGRDTQPQVNCEGCGRFPVPHVGAVTVVRPHHVGAIWKYNLPRFLLPDWTSPLQGKRHLLRATRY